MMAKRPVQAFEEAEKRGFRSPEAVVKDFVKQQNKNGFDVSVTKTESGTPVINFTEKGYKPVAKDKQEYADITATLVELKAKEEEVILRLTSKDVTQFAHVLTMIGEAVVLNITPAQGELGFTEGEE